MPASSMIADTTALAPHPDADGGAQRPWDSRQELAEWTRQRLRDGRRGGAARRRAAEDAVVVEHLWLARTVAGRYHHRGEDPDDLMQVASTGLVEAVHRFDPDRGDFVPFAAPTISGVVKRYFRDQGWLVRPPRRTQELVGDLRREWSDLAQELGHTPTGAEIGARLGESGSAVAEAQCASQGYRPVSVDLLTEEHPLISALDQGAHDRVEATLIVQRVLRDLDPADRQLIRLRFYEGRSQSDIAAQIGTTQMQVSRRLTRLMSRMREMVGEVSGPSDGRPGRTAAHQASARASAACDLREHSA